MVPLVNWVLVLLTDEFYSDCPIKDEEIIDDKTIKLTLKDGTNQYIKIQDTP